MKPRDVVAATVIALVADNQPCEYLAMVPERVKRALLIIGHEPAIIQRRQQPGSPQAFSVRALRPWRPFPPRRALSVKFYASVEGMSIEAEWSR